MPLVEKLLQRAKQKGEIHFDDLQAAATFCVYGQLGILLADDLTQEDKSKRIVNFSYLHFTFEMIPRFGTGDFQKARK